MKTIPILYEDNQIVIFDKPSGLLVIPAKGKTKNILIDIVNEQYQGEKVRLHPCHRLDKETSGLIIYAKGKSNQQKIRDVFQKEAIEKTYFSFLKGRVKKRSGVIKSAIKDNYQKRFASNSRGKMAITCYEVVNYHKGFTVVKVIPKTGRTNQIRIHFAEIGHPMLGERVYAFRKDFTVNMKRLALHCYSIKFKNPVSGEKVYAVSDFPKDMKEFLQS